MNYQTSAEYWQAVADKVKQGRFPDRWKLVETLQDLNITSHAELINLLPQLPHSQQIAALKLFQILKVPSTGPALVACWLSADQEIRWEAKQALGHVKSRRAYNQLLKVIHHHSDVIRREEACYILAFSFDDVLVEPLLQIYATESYPPALRAQAAEGLANHLGYVDRRIRKYRQVVGPLLHGLNDPSPEVRFWTCFALGQMRAREALPRLQQVMEQDQALCPGWWHVKDEASDAINRIFNKPCPDRERIVE